MGTKKEQVLEEAILIAKEETQEELQMLLEGADVKECVKTIQKIFENLAELAICFEEFDTKDEKEPSKLEGMGLENKFEIGDYVKVIEKPFSKDWRLFEAFGIEDDETFNGELWICVNEVVEILDIAPPVYGDQIHYLIEYGDCKFFVEETDLEKLKEGEMNGEFSIGERAYFVGTAYEPTSEFFKWFGIVDKTGFVRNDEIELEEEPIIVRIISKKPPLYSDVAEYVVKYGDQKFFVEEIDLKKI